MNTLDLAITLLSRKYKNVDNLIKDVAKNEEHALFVFAKDFAKIICKKSEKWNWINENMVDDLNSIVINQIQKFLIKYYVDVLFAIKDNNLTYFLNVNDVEGTIKWLIERYVNVLKNTFDKRSSFFVNITTISFTKIENFDNIYQKGF